MQHRLPKSSSFRVRSFRSKSALLNHVRRLFGKRNALILVHGSTAHGRVRSFSDFDITVYRDRKNDIEVPYYEIALVQGKPVIITAYFYHYRPGIPMPAPKDVLVVNGEYNDGVKPVHFEEKGYTDQEWLKRQCQIAVDMMFKYLRHRKLANLKSVQKRVH